jgi:hypothetical protein
MARVVTRNPLWPRQAANGKPRKMVAPRQAPSVTTTHGEDQYHREQDGESAKPHPSIVPNTRGRSALDGSSAQRPPLPVMAHDFHARIAFHDVMFLSEL